MNVVKLQGECTTVHNVGKRSKVAYEKISSTIVGTSFPKLNTKLPFECLQIVKMF
jgi:hypothetical protein